MSTNWKKEYESATAAAEFLAKRVTELAGELELSQEVRDQAWEERKALELENLALRMTKLHSPSGPFNSSGVAPARAGEVLAHD